MWLIGPFANTLSFHIFLHFNLLNAHSFPHSLQSVSLKHTHLAVSTQQS